MEPEAAAVVNDSEFKSQMLALIPSLRAFARSLCGNPDMADDLAQEAMAREPKPAHVPRETKPVVAVDEGPLVLVETRKDLSQFKLPFETNAG